MRTRTYINICCIRIRSFLIWRKIKEKEQTEQKEMLKLPPVKLEDMNINAFNIRATANDLNYIFEIQRRLKNLN